MMAHGAGSKAQSSAYCVCGGCVRLFTLHRAVDGDIGCRYYRLGFGGTVVYTFLSIRVALTLNPTP